MMRIRALIRKEFLHLRRDRRLSFIIIFVPVLLLFLFGYAIRLQLTDVPMAVYDESKSYFSLQIKDALWRDGYFSLTEVGRLDDIQRGIVDGRFKAGLHIPSDLSSKISDNKTAHIHIFIDGTMPAFALVARGEVEILSGDDLSEGLFLEDPDKPGLSPARRPIALSKTILFNPDLRDVNFFLPGVIGILIMQVTLVLSSLAIVREKELQTLEQLLVSPVGRLEMIIAKVSPYGIIALVDFAGILALGFLVFRISCAGSMTLLALLGLIYVGSLLGLGVFLSTFSETQPQAIFLGVFVLIPSMLLSGFVFPIEAMPKVIQPIPQIIPLTYYMEIVRGILLKGVGLEVLWKDFLALVAFAVLFVLLSTLRFKKVLS